MHELWFSPGTPVSTTDKTDRFGESGVKHHTPKLSKNPLLDCWWNLWSRDNIVFLMNLNIFYCITNMIIESKEHDWLTRTDILSIIKRVTKKN